MKNYYIIVPKHEAAMNALNYNEANEDDLIELELNKTEFDELDNTGIFQQINNTCGTLIDEYEDESVTSIEDLKRCNTIISSLIENGEQQKVLFV
jgi:hypothetical protein